MAIYDTYKRPSGPSKLNVEGSSPFARFVRLVPFRPPPGSDTRQRRTSVQCRLLVLWVAVGAIGVLAAPAAPVWAQSGGPAGPGVDPAVVERVRQAIATIELFKVGSVTESAYEQADRVLLDHADVALSLLVPRLSEPEASLIEVLIEDLLDAGGDVTVLRPPLTGRDATARINALDIASDIDVSIEPLLSEIIGCINDPELFVRAETSLVLKELLPTLDDPKRTRAQSELEAMLVRMPENEYIPGLLEMLNEPWWLRWRLKIALSLVGVALLGAMVAVWSQRRRSSGRLT